MGACGSRHLPDAKDAPTAVVEGIDAVRERAASQIEARARGRMVRAKWQRQKSSVRLVQRLWRGKLGRDEAVRKRVESAVRQADVKKGAHNEIRRVNDYRLRKLMGIGSFGKVYSARHGREGLCAIKVLSRSFLRRKRMGRHGTAFDGVQSEIAVMRRLDHLNIVHLLEVIDDPDEDNLFLVMELVSGGDLSVPIRARRNVPEAQLRLWMRGVLLGLEYLHLSGVTHRDLKPENILWDAKRGLVKLADFGVSKIFDREQLGGSFVATTVGTLGFYSPEMCMVRRGEGFSGAAADVWAVGVCLYMWVFHRPPHMWLYYPEQPIDDADAPIVESIPELIAAIRTQPIAFPTMGRGAPIPGPKLIALIGKMLERAPRARARVRELRHDAWLTRNESDPLPPPPEGLIRSVPRREVQFAIKRVDLLLTAINNAQEGGAEDPAEQDPTAVAYEVPYDEQQPAATAANDPGPATTTTTDESDVEVCGARLPTAPVDAIASPGFAVRPARPMESLSSPSFRLP